MKSRNSATRGAVEELDVHWMLLLSGTPVQNNMRELQVRGCGGEGGLACFCRIGGALVVQCVVLPAVWRGLCWLP